ncbi:MAG: IS66 family transposase, partial [Bacteroidetes bacterium]|nr:IS66 family transposase [Bacteroidota bacterium]
AASTLDGWTRAAMEKLQILYDHLEQDTKSKGYLQVDETPIKVLDKDKQGSCHLGYFWVYHSPIDKTVLFDYQPTVPHSMGRSRAPVPGSLMRRQRLGSDRL